MRKLLFAGVSALALAVSSGVYADDSADAMDGHATYGSYNAANDGFVGSVVGGYSADDLIGADILNADGDAIDEVSDLMIDQNNEITHVLVDVGGVLGIGTKTVALPIDDLRVVEGSSDEVRFVTSMTEDQLEDMPAYVERDGAYEVDVDLETSTD